MTPVEQAELLLELARAEEQLAQAKEAGDPEALREVKHSVREVRGRIRQQLTDAGLRAPLYESDVVIAPDPASGSAGIQGGD